MLQLNMKKTIDIQISKTKYPGYSRLPFTVSMIVILFISATISFAQKKAIPAGFPVDCPTVQPVSRPAVNTPPARISSDLLVKNATELVNQPNKENVLGAIVLLEKAVAIDSTNAEAFYQLSSAHGMSPRYAGVLAKTGEEKSTFYFLKAFSLNPNSVDGIRGLANRMIALKNDYACAEKLLVQILETEPKNAWIRFEYAILLAVQNNFEEAYKNRAAALANADSLTTLRILNNSSRMRFMAHDYNWVIKHCDSLITNQHPKTNWLAHFYKGLALAEQGKYEQALAQQKLATPSLKGDAGGVANLARAYILADDILNGKLALREVLHRNARGEKVVAYQIATAYEAMGDFDNTFLWLNKVVDNGDNDIHGWLLWLNHDPRWKRIRNDVRFKEIKVRAGL